MDEKNMTNYYMGGKLQMLPEDKDSIIEIITILAFG